MTEHELRDSAAAGVLEAVVALNKAIVAAARLKLCTRAVVLERCLMDTVAHDHVEVDVYFQ